MSLAVCAIFRDEAPYLAEWLEFHLHQGASRFYLYDHESRDSSHEVLAPYVAAGVVELTEITGESPQMPAYAECLHRHHNARISDPTDWLAFIDIDEFLYSPIGAPLPDVLTLFRKHPAVVVNWAVYGPGPHLTRPPVPVVQAYLHRAAETFPPNAHVKSIVQPLLTEAHPINDPHSFHYREGSAVNERLEPVAGPFNDRVTWDLLRINHYWSRSIEEAERKTLRGRADCNQPRMPLEQLIAPETSAIYDDSAVRSLQSLAA